MQRRLRQTHNGENAKLAQTLTLRQRNGDYACKTTALTAASSRRLRQTGHGKYTTRKEDSEHPRHAFTFCLTTYKTLPKIQEPTSGSY
jgi:hypothetical protein